MKTSYANIIPIKYRTWNKVTCNNACKGADFKADLSTTKVFSRSSHRASGNKQLHNSMESNLELRNFLKNKYGADFFERTGKGLNPRGAQGYHDHTEKFDLHLVDKVTHQNVHWSQGTKGGYHNFYSNKH